MLSAGYMYRKDSSDLGHKYTNSIMILSSFFKNSHKQKGSVLSIFLLPVCLKKKVYPAYVRKTSAINTWTKQKIPHVSFMSICPTHSCVVFQVSNYNESYLTLLLLFQLRETKLDGRVGSSGVTNSDQTMFGSKSLRVSLLIFVGLRLGHCAVFLKSHLWLFLSWVCDYFLTGRSPSPQPSKNTVQGTYICHNTKFQ